MNKVRITRTYLVEETVEAYVNTELPLPIVQTEDGELFERAALLIGSEIDFSVPLVKWDNKNIISTPTIIKVEEIK